MGLPPISTIGFGFMEVSSEMRVPVPPAKIILFIVGGSIVSKLYFFNVFLSVN